MRSRILWLRISFWTGAVIDALAVVPLVYTPLQAFMYGIPDFAVTPVINNFAFTGAALMLGWTVLLIWADRKPLERKGILPITVVPVVTGIAASNIYLVIEGVLVWQNILPTLVMQVLISTLFLFSYYYARGGEKAGARSAI